MRTSSVAFLFVAAGSGLLALASPGMGETILSFKPPVLAPYNTAFVQNGSCPDGTALKVTGAIRGLDRRIACVSSGRRADHNIPTFGLTPT